MENGARRNQTPLGVTNRPTRAPDIVYACIIHLWNDVTSPDVMGYVVSVKLLVGPEAFNREGILFYFVHIPCRPQRLVMETKRQSLEHEAQNGIPFGPLTSPDRMNRHGRQPRKQPPKLRPRQPARMRRAEPSTSCLLLLALHLDLGGRGVGLARDDARSPRRRRRRGLAARVGLDGVERLVLQES